MGFKEFSYWPLHVDKPKPYTLDKEVEFMDNKKCADYISKEICIRSMLVYGSDALMEELVVANLHPVHLKGAIDWEMLRRLDEPKNEKQYQLIVATDSKLMRGIDLRAG